MKKLMEDWRSYVKETQIAKIDGSVETVRPVYKTENWFVYKMGKTREGVYYALGHLPSGMVIPSSYYIARGGPRGKKWQAVANLADHLEEVITAEDISSPDISQETIKQIQHAILDSDFARPDMSYTRLEEAVIKEYYRLEYPLNAKLLEEVKVPDFLKKLAFFGAAGAAGAGIGIGAATAIGNSSKEPVTQVDDDSVRLTDLPSYGAIDNKGPARLPIEKNWADAPTGGDWVWVSPDNISPHEHLTMTPVSAKDYRTFLMQDDWSIEALHKLLYGDSGRWAYGESMANAFEYHPDGGKMLPLDWSIAYDVYEDKVEDKINKVLSHPEAGTDEMAKEFGEKDWDSLEKKLMKLQTTIQK